MSKCLKNGFTIMETIVVCAIIVIISSTAVSIMAGMGEKNSLREVKVKIPVILENLSWKAMERGEIVEVMFDFNKKTVLCKNDEKVLSEDRLPENLIYEDVNGNKLIKRNTTPTGNMSMPFSIYVFSKDKKRVLYKITGDTTSPAKILIVRKYRPTEFATVENCKNEKLFSKTWIKE